MITIKKCRSCKTDIDEKATKCPHCRVDQRGWFRRHPILTGLLALFIIGVILSAAGAGSSTPTTSGTITADTNAQQEQSQPTSEQPTAPVAMKVAAADLIAEFDKNQLAAEEKYKDTSIEFTAVIGNISEDIMGTPFLSLQPTEDKTYFGTTIKCEFKDKSELTSFANGQTVTVQGTVTSQSLGIIGVKECKAI